MNFFRQMGVGVFLRSKPNAKYMIDIFQESDLLKKIEF